MKFLFASPVSYKIITLFISQYTLSIAKAANALGHKVKVLETTKTFIIHFYGEL